MVPIPKPLSSERHFRSKKSVPENSPNKHTDVVLTFSYYLRALLANRRHRSQLHS